MRFIIIITLFLSTSIVVAQPFNDGCLNKVNGQIINAQDNTIIPNATIYIKSSDGTVDKVKADSTGNFSLNLPCDDSRYMINATIENYTKSTKLVFTTKDYPKDHELTLDLIPVKEFAEAYGRKKIITESVNFPPNSKSVDSESIAGLHKVFEILHKYPDMNIEIGIHSDSRGDEDYILNLTQQRANSCASYLVDNGIESSRITAKGYGATQLVNDCIKGVKCSDEKHLKNRRSEFIVVKKILELAQL